MIVAIYKEADWQHAGSKQLHSTLGRIIGRTVLSWGIADILQNQPVHDHPISRKRSHHWAGNIPATGEFKGVSFIEAPAALSHSMVIKDGIISNYQAIVPSTWNSVRVTSMMTSVLRAVAGGYSRRSNKPLEVVRTILLRSCMACAVRVQCRRQR